MLGARGLRPACSRPGLVGIAEARVRVLVTGGAGFIGHHLVRGLLARGDEVAVIDDLSTGFAARLDPWRDRIAVTEGSILDPAALDAAVAGCEVILHEAAIPSVARSLVRPQATERGQRGRHHRGHARGRPPPRPAGRPGRLVVGLRHPGRAALPRDP